MKIFKNKNSAFTLMEISLVILILSVLIMLTLPIINKQLEKSNEYSYFLAYKTVEKLGSQIVAFGDAREDTALNNTIEYPILAEANTNKDSREKIYQSFVKKISNALTPKVYATPSEITSWSEYEYNIAKLCMHYGGETNYPPDKVLLGNDGTTSTYLNYETLISNWNSISTASTAREKNPCYALYGDINNITEVTVDRNLIIRRFTGQNSYSSDIAYDMWNSTPESFCTSLRSNTTDTEYKKVSPTISSISGSSVNKDNVPYYICVLKTKEASVSLINSTRSALITTPTRDFDCTTNGFTNTTYNSSTGRCECMSGYTPSLNNNNICCPTPTTNNYAYSYQDNSTYSCVTRNCKLDRYNEITHTCCPLHSKYSLSSQKCICDDGYKMNASNVCQLSYDCQPGTHLNSAGICVTNAPISKAKRFCELIADNFNVQNANCNTFSQVDDVNVNTTLFNNVTVNNNFMSINTQGKEHVFRDTSGEMEPNIVFSNGLKLWILGDKQASIAGLSYNPTGYENSTNVCKKLNLDSESTCGNSNGRYFCKPENQCFEIKRTYNNNPASALKDARNCCSTLNLFDIINSYAARGYLKDARTYAINGFTIFVDIDGDKGDGTLWVDVFPFFVSANGKVYPAYPLDAPKNSPSKYIGGNSTALTADVYYYEQDDDARKRIVAYSSIPYARAACFARDISAYTPYCLNLGTAIRGYDETRTMDEYINSDGNRGIPENPCFTHRCFIHVKNKLRFL